MCGICGFVSMDKSWGRETIDDMCSALVHRGPDSSGSYLNNHHGSSPAVKLERGGIGLGHRRLSIIDLSAAASQPMKNEDGSVWLVFNGEIYNYRELKVQLEERGHFFSTLTDSEVIVHGYEEWGEGVVDRLNGMFAFAVWDAARGKLMLARDRVGIKPLYVYPSGGTLLFASEIGALRMHPLFEDEIDRAGLFDLLVLSYVPSPHTLFKGTRRLLPGTYMVWRNGQTYERRYWCAQDGDTFGAREGSFEEALEEIDRLIGDSVSKRLISDVPLGAFLSGGIDSSLVVALMKRFSKDVLTFSIGFDDDEFDESRYASLVAEHLGTNHTEFILEPRITEGLLSEVIGAMDEPIGDPSVVPTYLVSSLAKKNGITVALSGDGGDELFCGYERYRKMQRLSVLYSLPKWVRRTGAALGGLLPFSMGGAADALRYGDIAEAYYDRMSSWTGQRGLLERIISDESTSPGGNSGDPSGIEAGSIEWGGLGRPHGRAKGLFERIFNEAGGLENLEKFMLTDFKTYLVDDVLTKVDRMSMAVSLEVRVPLLDHRVVEFAMSMPLEYKYRSVAALDTFRKAPDGAPSAFGSRSEDSFFDRRGLRGRRIGSMGARALGLPGGGEGGTLKYILKELAYRYVPRDILERPKSGFAIPVRRWLLGDLREMFEDTLSNEKITRERLLDPAVVRRVIEGFKDGSYRNARFVWGLFAFELWMDRFELHKRAEKGRSRERETLKKV